MMFSVIEDSHMLHAVRWYNILFMGMMYVVMGD